jgi:hypothetical protein
LKAPRLIARSFSRPSSGGLALDRFRKEPAGEIDRDLAITPNPFVHADRTFLSLFNGQGCSRRWRRRVDRLWSAQPRRAFSSAG